MKKIISYILCFLIGTYIIWIIISGIWRFLCPTDCKKMCGDVKMSVPLPSGTDNWQCVKFGYVQTNVIFGQEKSEVTSRPGIGLVYDKARGVWSGVCPHLGCTLEFEKDSDKIQLKTGYDAGRKVISNQLSVADENTKKSSSQISNNIAFIYCPCHQSVFEVKVDQKGDLKANVVQGPATEPPEKLDVEWVKPIDQPIEAKPATE